MQNHPVVISQVLSIFFRQKLKRLRLSPANPLLPPPIAQLRLGPQFSRFLATDEERQCAVGVQRGGGTKAQRKQTMWGTPPSCGRPGVCIGRRRSLEQGRGAWVEVSCTAWSAGFPLMNMLARARFPRVWGCRCVVLCRAVDVLPPSQNSPPSERQQIPRLYGPRWVPLSSGHQVPTTRAMCNTARGLPLEL